MSIIMDNMNKLRDLFKDYSVSELNAFGEYLRRGYTLIANKGHQKCYKGRGYYSYYNSTYLIPIPCECVVKKEEEYGNLMDAAKVEAMTRLTSVDKTQEHSLLRLAAIVTVWRDLLIPQAEEVCKIVEVEPDQFTNIVGILYERELKKVTKEE